MTTVAEFFGVLLLLYLIECGAWIPRTSFGLARGRRRARVVHPPEVLGNQGSGWLTGDVLPWGSALHLLHPWPVALDARGLVVAPVLALDPALRDATEPAFVPWEQLGGLSCDGARLFRGRHAFAHAGTSARARTLRALLDELARTPVERRGVAIDDALRRGLDPDVVRERLKTFERLAPTVSVLASAHLLFVFGVAPIVVSRVGFETSWAALLAGLAAITLANAVAFVLAHRRLFPTEAATRWGLAGQMLVVPISAARSRDLLARDLFDGCDPVLVSALLGGADTRPAVLAALRDLAHPARPGERIADLDARATLDGFRARWRARLVEALAPLDVDASLADVAPPREPGALSYCPRCLMQFVARDVSCDVCGDRATRAFDV